MTKPLDITMRKMIEEMHARTEVTETLAATNRLLVAHVERLLREKEIMMKILGGMLCQQRDRAPWLTDQAITGVQR